MLIWIGLPFKELQMKERKAVDQLVLSIALALSEGRELTDEPALLQFLTFPNSSDHSHLQLSMAVLHQIDRDNATDRRNRKSLRTALAT